MELSPHGLTAALESPGIRRLVGVARIAPRRPIQCSTTRWKHATLVQKLFRGEPAIAEFDWNFSSTLNSSQSVARLTGSDLHVILLTLHPGQG